MTITGTQVREAFQSAGLWNQHQLDIAENLANRIENLAGIEKGCDGKFSRDERAAIGNLYGHIRNTIFNGRLSKEEAHRANNITYEALTALGVDKETLAGMYASSARRFKFDADFQATRAMMNRVSALANSWWRPEFEAVRKLAEDRGLQITPISWDDPNRVGTNSAWGDNIIDAGIDVRLENAKTGISETFAMPLVRSPNFEDVTADIGLDKFMIPVGNASGADKTFVSLEDALRRPWELMHDPEQWPLKTRGGNNKGIYAAGVDMQAKVAAQSTLLAVSEEGGLATFNPTAYSYTSFTHPDHGVQPTVLNILVTQEGTSMQVLGKSEDGAEQSIWSYSTESKLYFNENGQKAPLTAERSGRAVTGANGGASGTQLNQGLENVMFHIQVPLIPEHDRPAMPWMSFAAGGPAALETTRGGGDLEHAVIGHGPVEGPYDEDLGKGWRRDTDVPVRVTVQFAKVLSDPDKVNWEEALDAIKAEIEGVYKDNGATRIGSLVITSSNPDPVWPPMPPIVPFVAPTP